MSNQPTSEKTVIEEVIQNLIQTTEYLKKELLAKNEALLEKETQTQLLLAKFEDKFDNVVIQAPKPDLSEVNSSLNNGLANINQNIEKWPKPLKKEYCFTLFPSQLRSVEYVRAVLTRIILCLVALVFLIFTYLLLDKHL